MEKQYKRLSVDFPAEEYIYLKLSCTKQRLSMKEFVYRAIMRSIDEYEEMLDSINDNDLKNSRPWEDIKRELGLDAKMLDSILDF